MDDASDGRHRLVAFVDYALDLGAICDVALFGDYLHIKCFQFLYKFGNAFFLRAAAGSENNVFGVLVGKPSSD